MYTLGPWRLRDDGSEYVVEQACENGEDICVVDFAFENYEANAALIAAAPELLEACRVLARFGTSKNFGYMVDELRQQITREDCERARAAVRKAEGKV